jgi:hypothetical protein
VVLAQAAAGGAAGRTAPTNSPSARSMGSSGDRRWPSTRPLSSRQHMSPIRPPGRAAGRHHRAALRHRDAPRHEIAVSVPVLSVHRSVGRAQRSRITAARAWSTRRNATTHAPSHEHREHSGNSSAAAPCERDAASTASSQAPRDCPYASSTTAHSTARRMRRRTQAAVSRAWCAADAQRRQATRRWRRWRSRACGMIDGQRCAI